jgi:hypothetical protein
MGINGNVRRHRPYDVMGNGPVKLDVGSLHKLLLKAPYYWPCSRARKSFDVGDKGLSAHFSAAARLLCLPSKILAA